MSQVHAPLPILKLRIPKALLQNAEAGAAGTGSGSPASLYRKAVVRKEQVPSPARRSSVRGNKFAQKLRSLHCKVDVQKFRFKVGNL